MPEGSAQHRTSGATRMMPVASPCHQVEPVAEKLDSRKRVRQRERQQRARRRDRRGEGGKTDELHHIRRAAEAARHADMAPHQLGAHERLERAACGDHRRGEDRSFDGDVRGEAADPYAGPEAVCAEEQRREGDARSGPDRGRVARRNGQQKGELRRREIGGRDQGRLRQNGPAPGRDFGFLFDGAVCRQTPNATPPDRGRDPAPAQDPP